jgi:hypothetical protein
MLMLNASQVSHGYLLHRYACLGLPWPALSESCAAVQGSLALPHRL